MQASPTRVPQALACGVVPAHEPMQRFQAELDALKTETMAQVGERDARYVMRLLWWIRGLESLARALLIGSPWMPTWWLGTVMLFVSKVLQSGEFGHNVMHGQYDWMRDPRFDGKTHEWDLAGTKEDWRHTHNFIHHHYTNVIGLDRDFGYGVLRLSADIKWEPRYLIQVPYALINALIFEWAIGIYNMELERLLTEPAVVKARVKALWPTYSAKIWHQVKKDYLLWPVVAGLVTLALGAGFVKGWLALLTGHVMANVLRSVWNFIVIFVGHFPAGVAVFDAKDIEGESRGQWYVRQIRGSVNIRGGFAMQMMTGHLTHQIEHHLFPDMPSRRYVDIAPRVRDICKRHGVHYAEGSLAGLWVSVAWRLLRYSFPGGRSIQEAPQLASTSCTSA